MNTPEPKGAIEKWVRESEGAFSLPLSMCLGIDAKNDKEAVPAILKWIQLPRDPFEQRAAELSLRAFIDFECWLGTSAGHQDMIDAELLGPVDAAQVPAPVRAKLNEALAARPQQRERAGKAAVAWPALRPTDEAIYGWYQRRLIDAMK